MKLNQIDKAGLSIHAQPSIILNITRFEFSCNPFKALGLYDISSIDSALNVFKIYLGYEENVWSSRSNENFRLSLNNQDFYSLLGIHTTGFLQSEATGKAILEDGSNYSIPKLNKIERRRDYFSTPVCLFVWIFCWTIGYAPNRDELLMMVPPGQQVPELLSEVFKKVRTAQSGSFSYRISKIVSSSFSTVPEFKNTLLDTEYLITPDGFRKFLDFCTFIGSSPDCYIKMTTVTSDKVSVLPALNSGQQVTHSAIDTTDIDQNGRASLCISSFNSYPDTVKSVNLTDAVIVGASVSTNLGENLVKLTKLGLSDKFDIMSLNQSQIALFIIHRTSGSLPNDSYMDTIDQESIYDSQTVKNSQIPRPSKSQGHSSKMNKTKLINKLISVILDLFEISDSKERITYFNKLRPEFTKFSNSYA